MYKTDSRGNGTRRFGGSDWTPPATWVGHSYTSGMHAQGVNTLNEAKWSQYVPLTYGKTWVNGVAANTVGDPNQTIGEIILGFGYYGFASDPIDNITVVAANLLTPYATQTGDLLFRWYLLTDGAPNGVMNQGSPYNGTGNPYGSLLVIIPVLYAAVQSSASPMPVRALINQRLIPVFSDGGAVSSYQRTDLLAWCIYDLLFYARPDLYAQIDINSVIAYANICGQIINYNQVNGTPSSHRRYGVSLSIQSRCHKPNCGEPETCR